VLDLKDEGIVVVLNVGSHYPNKLPSSSALVSQPLRIQITQMLYPLYWNLIIREHKLTENTHQVNFSIVLNSLCIWSVIWVEAVTWSMHSPCVVVAAVEKCLNVVSVLVNCKQLYLIHICTLLTTGT